MLRLKAFLPLLLLLAVTIGSGIASGRFDHRWGPSVDLVDAGQRLDQLPEQFGNWHRQAVRPISAGVIEMLQCSGSLHHVYRNHETGDVVSLAMFVGPPGPMSVHTPQVCYTLAGHRLLQDGRQFKLRESDPPEEQFWGTTFKANSLEGGFLRVAHAWNAGNGWRAPERPRLTFGGAAKLYKVQVATSVATQAELAEHDPCRDFLRDFVPVVKKILK